MRSSRSSLGSNPRSPFVLVMLFVLVAVFVTAPLSAAPEETGNRLEVFGDSMSAGFLSAESVVHPPSLFQLSALLTGLVHIVLSGDMAQAGIFERRDLAWPAVLRRNYPELFGQLANVSVSGAHITDLPAQVTEAGAASNATAFFLVGHNDLCQNFAPPEAIGEYFGSWMRELLRQWDRTHERSEAIVLPTAEVHRVFETLRGYAWGATESGRALRCEDSWNRFFPYCLSHGKLLREGKLREYFVPRLEAARRAMAKAAEDVQKESGRGNTFRFGYGFLDDVFKAEYFSVDCYHLSARGQEELAENLAKTIGLPTRRAVTAAATFH